MHSIFNGDLLKVAPTQYISKPDAIKHLGLLTEGSGDVALIVHDHDLPSELMENIATIISKSHMIPMRFAFSGFSSDSNVEKIIELIKEGSVDFIIGVGGGRCLDTTKMVSAKTRKKLVTVPTSAATCAAWAPLANLYDDNGVYIKGIPMGKCPDLLLLDLNVCASAPERYMASGLLDAIAKYYESEVTVHGAMDTAAETGLLVAKDIYERVHDIGKQSYQDAKNKKISKEYYRAIEINVLQAGLVGGLGGAKIRTAAAHAIHHGMTRLASTYKTLHGEKVAFGMLAQMIITKKSDSFIEEYMNLCNDLEVNLSLENMGRTGKSLIEVQDKLRIVAEFACNPNSSIHRMKLDVTPDTLIDAMIEADKVWTAYKK